MCSDMSMTYINMSQSSKGAFKNMIVKNIASHQKQTFGNVNSDGDIIINSKGYPYCLTSSLIKRWCHANIQCKIPCSLIIARVYNYVFFLILLLLNLQSLFCICRIEFRRHKTKHELLQSVLTLYQNDALNDTFYNQFSTLYKQ